MKIFIFFSLLLFLIPSGCKSPHDPLARGNGKFGCIPDRWFNLDGGKFVEDPNRTDQKYIHFDHAIQHIFDQFEDPYDTKKIHDVYFRSTKPVVDEWNKAIAGRDINDIKIGINSKLKKDASKKIYFEAVTIYYKKEPIYSYTPEITHHEDPAQAGNKNLGKFGCVPNGSISFLNKRFAGALVGTDKFVLHFDGVDKHKLNDAGHVIGHETVDNVNILLSLDEMNKWNLRIADKTLSTIGIAICDEIKPVTGTNEMEFKVGNVMMNDEWLGPNPECKPTFQ